MLPVKFENLKSGTILETITKIMEALAREEFDPMLLEILATAEKKELEKLAISLTKKAGEIDSTRERDILLRGVQSIRFALKIRNF